MTNLQEIEARAEAATPGPWEWWSSCSHWRLTGADGKDGGVIHAYKASDGFPCVSVSEEDRDFIAHARQDIPLLLSELRKLDEMLTDTCAERDAIKAEVEQLYSELRKAREREEAALAKLYMAPIIGNAGAILSAREILHQALSPSMGSEGSEPTNSNREGA